MAKLYVQRRALVERLLRTKVWCERCNTGRSRVVHEKKLRSAGGDILDEENCVVLCTPCHDFIHRHPKESQRLGWLQRRFE